MKNRLGKPFDYKTSKALSPNCFRISLDDDLLKSLFFIFKSLNIPRYSSLGDSFGKSLKRDLNEKQF